MFVQCDSGCFNWTLDNICEIVAVIEGTCTQIIKSMKLCSSIALQNSVDLAATKTAMSEMQLTSSCTRCEVAMVGYMIKQQYATVSWQYGKFLIHRRNDQCRLRRHGQSTWGGPRPRAPKPMHSHFVSRAVRHGHTTSSPSVHLACQLGLLAPVMCPSWHALLNRQR